MGPFTEGFIDGDVLAKQTQFAGFSCMFSRLESYNDN
jgi:hypothetical protein